jgi:hypothetical protein
MKGELLIPPSAQSDPKSAEIIRAWIANGGLHCSLNPLIWPGNESVGWGILMSDVIRHVADALHVESGLDKAETIEKIRKVLNDELRSPTAETEGNFVL